MSLTKQEIEQIREELNECKNPLFFFHDDPDGLCSFLLLYKIKKEGHGIILKIPPEMGVEFLRKVKEYDPDKIFILDKARVSQEFIDGAKRKVIWIDHHDPYKRENVLYFNPRVHNKNDNTPVSYICYEVAQKDLWLGVIGSIGDWFMPPDIDKFRKKYPDLIPIKTNKPEEIYFSAELGKLVKIFSFVLKGDNKEAMKCVKILTRIKGPYEILEQKTSQGRYIYKRYEKINKIYEKLLNDALAKATKEELLLYIYDETTTSFTSDLSNELLYRFPEKIILIGRKKSDEIKFSFRSTKLLLPQIVEASLKGVEGYGGGHEHACGISIKGRYLDVFLNNLKKELEKNK